MILAFSNCEIEGSGDDGQHESDGDGTGRKVLAEMVRDYTTRKVLMAREALELIRSEKGGKTAHGDIKMENILIDADGHAKLCDFGAAESEDVSATHSAMTQLYVSPERMESDTGKATCEADVWSLGVVLYG
ncbi:putative Protein kinase domain containing protein [Blattamonas nauphoetae]|uniref:mitogen-activated protein kinase kinase n=1 Tax=Blattamonas nauphoetae TaxID=2049346 RepID=A0ABQ9WMQ1_9EUKA|nr:putative Protein kinase domain containing protein [Blattamonas nauphoetae]